MRWNMVEGWVRIVRATEDKVKRRNFFKEFCLSRVLGGKVRLSFH
jgi:hypothetical protein